MRRSPDETIQEFSARFMKFYNSIPTKVKPPPRDVQLRYVDSFNIDFSLLLRERRSTSLDDMMSDEIEVEVNLMPPGKIKYNYDKDMNKVQDKAQPSTSQSSEERFEMMMKTMERMSLNNNPKPEDRLMFHLGIREYQQFHKSYKEIKGTRMINK